MKINEQQVSQGKTQIFLCASPSSLPASIGVHPWFVINRKGTLSRWEVLFRKIRRETHWGHLAKDYFRPFEGIEVFPYAKGLSWPGSCIGMVEGELAERMAAVIERSPATYPFAHRYFLPGPNSNTYAQWVLNQFPQSGLVLPWNAFGKGYKMRV